MPYALCPMPNSQFPRVNLLTVEPINNDEMEEYLGKIASRPSRVSQRILNSNGIQQRYYAIDKQQQRLYYNS